MDLHVFLIQAFSCISESTYLQFERHDNNIHLEGTCIDPSFVFMSKNGKNLIFFYFHDYFSRFHKIKNRTHITNMRHSPL